MSELTNLKLMAFAKFQAIFAALLGLAAGILYSVGGLVIDALVSLGLLSWSTFATSGLSIGTLLAFGALLGMPLIFAVAGFVLGVVEAVLYKLYVRKFKAVNINFWH